MLTEFIKEKILQGKAHSEGYMEGASLIFDEIEIKLLDQGRLRVSLSNREHELSYIESPCVLVGDVVHLKGVHGVSRVELF